MSRIFTAVQRALWPALTLLPAGLAFAQEATPSVQDQLAEQEQRLRVLERKLELANETAATAAASTPVVKAGPGGFSLQSADGKNVFKLRGTLNVDGRYFVDGVTPTTADTFVLRKVRPYFEGTVNGNYDFRFQPDFGGGRTVILDAYVAGRFKPWLTVTAGKFKLPVGLERLQTESFNRLAELSFVSSLVPNRDIGLQFSGNVFNNALSYAVAYSNGVIDGSSSEGSPTADTDTDGKHEVSARIFALPFANGDNFYLRGLGFGIAGSSGSKQGSATITNGTATTSSWVTAYRTPGQQSFFSYRSDTATTTTLNEATYANGSHVRISPQAYYYYGSLGLLGEYAESRQELTRNATTSVTTSAEVKNTAWQLTASFFLTGEDAAYNNVTPRNNFQIGKPGAGAWEVVARVQKLDIDDAAFAGGGNSLANPSTQPTAATGYSVGLNWYLNQNVRWLLEYDQTEFKGGAANSADRRDEKGLVTRFAVVF